MEERPGAVHLELPEDITDEDCDESIFDVVGFRRPDADELAIQAVAKMIENAKMPLLLIGAGANRKRTCRALTDFIEQTDAPFFNIQMGKGVVHERRRTYWSIKRRTSSDGFNKRSFDYDKII